MKSVYRTMAAVGLLVMLALALTFVMERWTVPVQNELTVAQVNGGDAEMVALHTARSSVDWMIQIMQWVVGFISGLLIFAEGKRQIRNYAERRLIARYSTRRPEEGDDERCQEPGGHKCKCGCKKG